MTVCGNRTDDPGMFTSCRLACGGCVCAAEVLEEYADRLVVADEARATADRELTPEIQRDPTFIAWTCPGCSNRVQVRSDLRDIRCSSCRAVSRAPEQPPPVPAGLGSAALPTTTAAAPVPASPTTT